MNNTGITISELAKFLKIDFSADGELRLSGIATLESAATDQLSFFHNPKYASQLAASNAGAVFVSAEYAAQVKGVALVVDDPYLAYAKSSSLFAGMNDHAFAISDTATVADSAQVSVDVYLGPNVVVGDGCVIAAGVAVGANTVIGSNCYIGKNSRISANVTLYSDVSLGQDCIVHSGAVIGADGFGFAPDRGQWVKIHQLGGVRIGDRVEIGAGTTIDRGALDDTIIENGVILDNQIQIAHNVVVGENTAIAGCTAVAGSTKIGKNCTIAGACGITGHLTIVEGTHITAMSLVSKSITRAGAYSSGTVAEPHQQWKKNVVRFRQLDELSRRVKAIESVVKQQNRKG